MQTLFHWPCDKGREDDVLNLTGTETMAMVYKKGYNHHKVSLCTASYMLSVPDSSSDLGVCHQLVPAPAQIQHQIPSRLAAPIPPIATKSQSAPPSATTSRRTPRSSSSSPSNALLDRGLKCLEM